MRTDKEIFDLIHDIGECLTGDLHVIDTSDFPKCSEADVKYRVYHNSGFCVDIEREYCCEPNEIDQYDDVSEDGFIYSWFAEWEGFHSVANNDQLYDLLYKWLKEILA